MWLGFTQLAVLICVSPWSHVIDSYTRQLWYHLSVLSESCHFKTGLLTQTHHIQSLSNIMQISVNRCVTWAMTRAIKINIFDDLHKTYTCVHEWGIFNVLIDALVRKLCMKMLKFIGPIHALQTKLVHKSLVILISATVASCPSYSFWPIEKL